MPAKFLGLPSELRNQIYRQLLVDEEPIQIYFGDYRQELNPSLLCVNRKIHREATPVLYAENTFDFTSCMFENLAAFLDQVGSNNSCCIRNICIDFPLLEDDATIEDDSARILERIQGDCINLSTLKTSLTSENDVERTLDSFDSPKMVAKAVDLVDARFRAIPSLQEIVVDVYRDSPSADTRKEMESHGWTINEIEEKEQYEEQDRFDWWGGYTDHGDSSHYDDEADEYDIDNDSDFWRRAGD